MFTHSLYQINIIVDWLTLEERKLVSSLTEVYGFIILGRATNTKPFYYTYKKFMNIGSIANNYEDVVSFV